MHDIKSPAPITDETIEAELQRKKPGTLRVKTEDLEAAIVDETYHLFPGTLLTVCVLTLRNGFNVTGESACVSPETFDADIGRRVARENAKQKLWPLLGYVLKENLNNAPLLAMYSDWGIARACHEVNRAYCQSLGDNSQPAWEDAPDWQRDSALRGVKLHAENPDATPAASHESWLKQKAAEGWKYGMVKNPHLKEHPCFMPFDRLPREQQAKDYIFRAVVHAMLGRVLGPIPAKPAESFQDRVRIEKAELDAKLHKLQDFLVSSIFTTLPDDERVRLQRQAHWMEGYSDILTERISAF